MTPRTNACQAIPAVQQRGRNIPKTSKIEVILRIDVEVANQELESAMAAFWRICTAPSTGRDLKGIDNALARQKRASDDLILALQRLAHFIREGIVPENL